jgi:Protein of unknown function (DUF1161)
MKRLLPIAGILLALTSVYGQAAKPCEELKTEIAKKMDAKGVKSYTLEIMAKDDKEGDGKVVGTCEGGTKKIVYTRTVTPPQAPAPEATKP